MKKNIVTSDNFFSPSACAERLKRVRNLANLTRKELCEKSGININTLKGWEIGRYGGLTKRGAEKIVKHLAKAGVQCTPEWLLFKIGSDPKLTPNFEELRDASEQTANQASREESNEEQKIIRELLFFREHYKNSVDYLIMDNAMMPVYQKGEYVAGIKRTKYFDALIGYDCIVQTADGTILLRALHPGRKAGFYNLISHNLQTTTIEPVIYDAILVSAAPVIWHRKKNPA